MFIKTSYAASYVWKIWIINCQDNLCFLYVSMENILWRVRKMWKGACSLKVDQLNLRFWAKDIPRDATALEMHCMNHLTSKLSSKIFFILSAYIKPFKASNVTREMHSLLRLIFLCPDVVWFVKHTTYCRLYKCFFQFWDLDYYS